ncbi:hypothetical protein T440DRAFT_471249 [Plenodomus tracheiphilus IPT5]|uniref:Secreted protein n=1 Tax=Plenodomus tracheiphilus IPT5 TaxID=1408161 RepID=A0A6A7AVM4_9PLEO|nr:hypothetical protein T440DRAFT_471249 [Plenodomus tracheiphilus IPT5]
MKASLPSTFLLLVGVAYSDLDCYCTGPAKLNPDKWAKICCTDTSGVTYPDGKDRPGTWNDKIKKCHLKTNGLGFTVNQMINAWAPCCRSTGPQGPNGEDLLWGGVC